MPRTLTLILGDQLFSEHPSLATESDYVMIESKDLCARFSYHKQKIAFVLTSMREYRDYLEKTVGKDHVHYFQLQEQKTFAEVMQHLSAQYTHLQYTAITDKKVARSILEIGKTYFADVKILESPMFLTPPSLFQQYLSKKSGKRLLMGEFYIWQRKRLRLLLNEDGSAMGGKWSFDEENRKKLPKSVQIPERPEITPSVHSADIARLIERYFPNNPGTLTENWLATNHIQARMLLRDFFKNFLPYFGDFEDALSVRSWRLFHSALSPYLNHGMLTPCQVIEELFQFLEDNQWVLDKHLNSVEGYLRQIIGWREWVKGLYDHVYSEDLENYNFFNSQKNIPEYFYFKNLDQMTNVPLKVSLESLEKYGWSHHIERLMVFGNYLTMAEVEPMQVYKWFMEMFVDAYDWVMVPNVFGMGTFADGGIFATKPYIAGSNYIKKMSDYPGGSWEDEWRDLFWNFLEKHRDFFEKQPRLGMLLKSRKKKNGDIED
jgi:deoxyribodipyrimidine photolyase-related protein